MLFKEIMLMMPEKMKEFVQPLQFEMDKWKLERMKFTEDQWQVVEEKVTDKYAILKTLCDL